MKPKVAFIGTGGTIASVGKGPLDLQDYGANGIVMHADEIISRWPETALVALSAVQSADGRTGDLAAVRAAAAAHGARTLVDATHAAGARRLAAAKPSNKCTTRANTNMELL